MVAAVAAAAARGREPWAAVPVAPPVLCLGNCVRLKYALEAVDEKVDDDVAVILRCENEKKKKKSEEKWQTRE